MNRRTATAEPPSSSHQAPKLSNLAALSQNAKRFSTTEQFDLIARQFIQGLSFAPHSDTPEFPF
jgi:hypothetical protein